MKVKGKDLQRLLEKHGLTAADFARDIEIDVSEVDKMLSGAAVGERTARKFIYYVGPIEADRLIDWAGMGKKSPFSGDNDKKGGNGDV